VAAAPPVPPRRLKELGSLRHVRGRDPGRASIICLVGALFIGETEEWTAQRRSMSAEALSNVQPVRFAEDDDGTEHALPVSLTA